MAATEAVGEVPPVVDRASNHPNTVTVAAAQSDPPPFLRGAITGI